MGADAAAEEQFGPYIVYERLGVGGMATVHRALERGIEGFERIVALKRLLPHLAEDATFIKAFVREAKLASLLHHINIVQIYELGRVSTEYFISMEYIDGRDIRRILRHARKATGPPPLHVTVGLLTQLCDALDYAHAKVDDDGHPLGLVHRDVSPSNLLVTTQGHLKVIDFGIAKAQSQQLKTQTGRVKGKLAYMAPEAISGGRELDARSDLFACGVIAHELLTARPLFASKNEYQTLMKVQRGDILPPSTFNQACPAEMDAIVARALARDPDERYPTAAALREDLSALRRKLKLNCGFRDVAQWIDWAFTVEPPAGFAVNATIDQTGSAFKLTPPHVHKTPTPRPRFTDEDAAVEIAWGGGEGDGSVGPIVIDDVPDVSEKLAAISMAPPLLDDDDIPAHTPSHGALGSDPDVNVSAITPARAQPIGVQMTPDPDRPTGKRPAVQPAPDDPPTGRRGAVPDRTDPSVPPVPASMFEDDDPVAPPPPPVQPRAKTGSVPIQPRAKTGSEPGTVPRQTPRPGSQPNSIERTASGGAIVARAKTGSQPGVVPPRQTPRPKTASGLNEVERRSSSEISRASPPGPIARAQTARGATGPQDAIKSDNALPRTGSGPQPVIRPGSSNPQHTMMPSAELRAPAVERPRTRSSMPLPATPVESAVPALRPSQPLLDPPGVLYARGPRTTRPGIPAQSRPPATTTSRDVVHDPELMSTARRPKRSSHVPIGASLLERKQATPKWWIPVLAIVVLGGAGGAYFLLRTPSDDKPVVDKGSGSDKAAVAPPAPAVGTVKFETEPADAEIRIDGQVVHTGTPWATELAPGKHPIEIHKAGYKSWLTTVELSATETQTFRVVLEALGTTNTGEASLSLSTTPSGLEATLDGKPLPTKTPIKMPLKPGVHQLAVKKGGVEVWHQEVRAQPSTVYEFNPIFTEKKPEPKKAPVDRVTGRTEPPENVIGVVKGDASPPEVPPDAAVEAKVEPPKPIIDKPTPPPTITTPPKPVAPVAPVGIRAGDVTRVSGSMPNIVKGRYDDDLPPTISVKLCIDTGGHVSSAGVLTKNVSHNVSDEILGALRAWVYSPYKKAGVATPACFVVNLRTSS